ncbi:MAG: hypothetical protein LBP95_13685 [Deltaproteobacteria bacterium]|nr:hypothetical protein [Deltaproteobacteria bacterium]
MAKFSEKKTQRPLASNILVILPHRTGQKKARPKSFLSVSAHLRARRGRVNKNQTGGVPPGSRPDIGPGKAKIAPQTPKKRDQTKNSAPIAPDRVFLNFGPPPGASRGRLQKNFFQSRGPGRGGFFFAASRPAGPVFGGRFFARQKLCFLQMSCRGFFPPGRPVFFCRGRLDFFFFALAAGFSCQWVLKLFFRPGCRVFFSKTFFAQT